jgi:hypothetical protein
MHLHAAYPWRVGGHWQSARLGVTCRYAQGLESEGDHYDANLSCLMSALPQPCRSRSDSTVVSYDALARACHRYGIAMINDPQLGKPKLSCQDRRRA